MKKLLFSAVFAFAIGGLFAQSSTGTSTKPAGSKPVASQAATNQKSSHSTGAAAITAKTGQQPAKSTEKPKVASAAKSGNAGTGTGPATQQKKHRRRHKKTSDTTGSNPANTPGAKKPASGKQ